MSELAPKFGVLDEAVPYRYGNIFFREPLSSGDRLVIGPYDRHVELMLALAETWPTQQYYVLYVLLVSHSGAGEGRYQSPPITSFEDLQAFFYTFDSFFESDGRHHVWIGSTANEGLLVYDQHNVIFAYGDVSSYEAVLASRDFTEREFWFPAPHCHSFPPPNVQQEEEVLSYFTWEKFPLQDGDEWD
jgi:hypothetical protein